jgi:hypothetical protein
MADINIDKALPQSLDSLQSSYASTTDETKQESSASASIDSLSSTTTTPQVVNANLTSSKPQLVSPGLSDNSALSYSMTLGNAKVSFSQQLSASDLVDQASRNSGNDDDSSVAAQSLSDLLDARAAFIDLNQTNYNTYLNTLTTIGDNAPNETTAMQEQMSDINNDNSTEQTQANNIRNARNTYIQQVSNLPGVVKNANGTFTIPAKESTQYNILTALYNNQVATFNNNTTNLVKNINNYNQTVTTYNQQANSDNAAITAIKNNTQYDFPDAIANGTFPDIPLRDTASSLDTSDYNTLVSGSSSVNSNGGTVNMASDIPSGIQDIATNGAPSLQPVSSYDDFVTDDFTDQLNNVVNTIPLEAYDATINASTSIWASLNAFALLNPVPDTIPDPLLNAKKITSKLLAPANNTPSQPVALGTGGANALSGQVLETSNSHVQGILGLAVFKKLIYDFNTNLSEDQITNASNQLVKLGSDLLANNSLNSVKILLPETGPLNANSPLPADSPALSILHSLSLTQRVIAAANGTSTQDAINSLIKSIPVFANLTPDQVKQLAAVVNLSQLLVAFKLLGDNLGLPNLSTQFLADLNINPGDPITTGKSSINSTSPTTTPVSTPTTANSPNGVTAAPISTLSNNPTTTSIPNNSTNSPFPAPPSLGSSTTPTTNSAPSSPGSSPTPTVNSTSSNGTSISPAATGSIISPNPTTTLANSSIDLSNATTTATNSTQPFSSTSGLASTNINSLDPEQNATFNTTLNNPLVSALDNINSSFFVSSGLEEASQANKILANTVATNFSNQGYGPNEANFLGQTAATLVNQGLNTPTVATVTSSTVDQSVLVDSIKASLILLDSQKFDLASSDVIANNVVNQTLENSYKSSALFRSALTTNLEEAGVGNEAPSVALDAVLNPAQTVDLAQASLPKNELANLVNSRLTSLVTPQLGKPLTNEVRKELFMTLFGTPQPDSSDIANVKSPNALPNVINKQIRDIHIGQDHTYATALNTQFKDTVKNTEDAYAYSVKVMDPAYIYALSTQLGNSHLISNRKASIDINV